MFPWREDRRGDKGSAAAMLVTSHLLCERSWGDKPGLEAPPGVSPHLLLRCGPGCTKKPRPPGSDPPPLTDFESEEEGTSTP